MTNKKMFELLTLVEGVRVYSWDYVQELVKVFNGKEPITILKKEWGDSYKQNNPSSFPLNLNEVKTWTTINDMEHINIKFENDNNKLHCYVLIKEGGSFRSDFMTTKFKAEFILPNSFLKKIEKTINWAFESYLEESYENHLKSQRKLWIEGTRNQILNSK
jgi:hypothetical protein